MYILVILDIGRNSQMGNDVHDNDDNDNSNVVSDRLESGAGVISVLGYGYTGATNDTSHDSLHIRK